MSLFPEPHLENKCIQVLSVMPYFISQLVEDQKIEHLADGAEGGGDENGENLGVGKALFNPEVQI